MHGRFRSWAVRVLLALVVSGLLSGVGSHPTSAEDPAEPTVADLLADSGFGAADTLIDAAGYIGYNYLPETYYDPGVQCDHWLFSKDSDFTKVWVEGPAVRAHSYYSYLNESQDILWQITVYRPGGTLVAASDILTTRVYDYVTTLLPQLNFVLPIGGDYYVRADIAWLDPITDEIVGGSSRFYDFYRIYFSGNYGATNEGVDFSCNPGLFVPPPPKIIASTKTTVAANFPIALVGFPSKAPVNVQWDGVTIASDRLKPDGTLSGSVKIPPSVYGPHTLRVVSGTRKVSVTVNVAVRIRFKPETGAVGTSVNATLTGFAAGENVTVTWYNGTKAVKLGTVKMNSTGGKDFPFTVPTGAAVGNHEFRASGDKGHSAKVTFKVTAASVAAAEADADESASATPEPTETGSRRPSPRRTETGEGASDQAPTATADATVEPSATAEPTETPTETGRHRRTHRGDDSNQEN